MSLAAVTSGSRNPPELDNLSREVGEHIARQVPIYETLARAYGYSIGFGETTCFDHTANRVIIGVAQLAKMGVKDLALIDFIVLHEIGHFCEFREDPDGYLKVSENSKKRPAIDGQLYFDLYNCLQDIYVNKNTADRAPVYRNGSGFSDPICDLYRSYLFANRDLTTRPLCVQFMQYLLNLGMGVTSDIKLSPEILAEAKAGFTVFGQQVSYEKFIETYLLPALGQRSPKGWKGTMTQRGFLIEQAVVPVFEKLLAIDKARGKGLTGFVINPLALIEPDPESIDKAIKDAIDKRTEANLPASERAKRTRDKQATDIAGKVGLTPVQAREFADTLERVQPEIHEVVSLFMKLRQKVTSWKNVIVGPFSQGTDLSIEAAIDRFNDVQDRPAEAQVLMRSEPRESVTLLPKKIRLWVIPDLSGSMNGHLAKVKDLTVALAASMATLCQQAELTESDLQGELGVIGFHEEAIPLIEPSSDVTLASIASTFPKITADGSDTNDHTALAEVLSRIKKLQLTSKPGETIDILIEITDGETNLPFQSRQLLEDLESLGVIAGAVKIGYSTEPDVKPDKDAPKPEPEVEKDPVSKYDQVWNTGAKNKGQYVSSAKQLGKAVSKILEDVINEITSKELA